MCIYTWFCRVFLRSVEIICCVNWPDDTPLIVQGSVGYKGHLYECPSGRKATMMYNLNIDTSGTAIKVAANTSRACFIWCIVLQNQQVYWYHIVSGHTVYIWQVRDIIYKLNVSSSGIHMFICTINLLVCSFHSVIASTVWDQTVVIVQIALAEYVIYCIFSDISRKCSS